MSKKHWVNRNHYRVSSPDRRSSVLYKTGYLGMDRAVEVTDHYRNGEAKSYHYDNSFAGVVFNGGRGEKK
jgi:hypothetical protein